MGLNRSYDHATHPDQGGQVRYRERAEQVRCHGSHIHEGGSHASLPAHPPDLGEHCPPKHCPRGRQL